MATPRAPGGIGDERVRAAETVAVSAASPAGVSVAAGSARPTARVRVLLIDDEPMVGRALGRLLATEHDVTVLTSAREAVRRIGAGEAWEAILCDLMMPDMDGVAFRAALERCRPRWVSRLAFMSGGGFGARADGFFAETPLEVIPKPASRLTLAHVLERLARNARLSGEPSSALGGNTA
jgi:two-component system NtrC family sensor kinase